MDIQLLYQISKREAEPKITDTGSLKNLVHEYPYFQAAIFIYLKALYLQDADDFHTELKRLSITVSDRKALFYYILSEDFDYFFQQTGKKAEEEDRTKILLNAFFETREDNALEEELEYSISNSSLATTDYFSYLQISKGQDTSEDLQTPKLKHQNIIDSFIDKAEHEGGIRIIPETEEENKISAQKQKDSLKEDTDELNEDIFFTETLAKIYIKQKKYEKAYKIIKHLSLNYPKKNIYFADQLNFLEKLIINTKFKDIK